MVAARSRARPMRICLMENYTLFRVFSPRSQMIQSQKQSLGPTWPDRARLGGRDVTEEEGIGGKMINGNFTCHLPLTELDSSEQHGPKQTSKQYFFLLALPLFGRGLPPFMYVRVRGIYSVFCDGSHFFRFPICPEHIFSRGARTYEALVAYTLSSFFGLALFSSSSSSVPYCVSNFPLLISF